MAPKQYAKYVKNLPIKDYDEGGFRQGTELTSAWLGFDVNIKYGTYWTAGKIAPYTPHVHDYDQVLLFAGSDMDDIGELGAEVALCLGEDMETHMITTTTARAIPRALPHFPATVNRLDKRFLFMEISIAKECRETPLDTGKKPGGFAGWRAKTRK